MKKLLFVITQLYRGGAEVSLVNFLNNLDPKYYDIELLILNQYPVKNAVSIVNDLKTHIKVYDAYKEYQKVTLFDRVRAKVMYKSEQKFAYYFTALDFVKNKVYDWAFHIGEWNVPSFVAYEVNAKIKVAWIHSDISKNKYFDEDSYFYFADHYDYFVFASKNSMKTSIECYPFLEEKSHTIYNMINQEMIKEKSKMSVDDIPKGPDPIFVTCANIRPEKNHLLQIEIMKCLKEKNINFKWINIGSKANKKLVKKVEQKIKEYGLEADFILLDSRENPYPYIREAAAVTVLSEYESWSMVITEARVLGIPVIATKTSGALEQIQDGITGVLTDFTLNNMVEKIEEFLKNTELQERIKKNLQNFEDMNKIILEFDQFINNGRNYIERYKKDILYIIDDINYNGGAHIATREQIKFFLKNNRCITVFSSTVPNIKIRNELKNICFLSLLDVDGNLIYNTRCLNILLGKKWSLKDKIEKIRYVYEQRVKHNTEIFNLYIFPRLESLFSEYDIVCNVSESSIFRKFLANSNSKKKIQWIHTDYTEWQKLSDYTKKITRDDSSIYKKMDEIVLLSKNIEDKFLKQYPELIGKTRVVENLIPVDTIKEKSMENIENANCINFVSIARLDCYKNFGRLLDILNDINGKINNFTWKIIGGGEEYLALAKKIERYNLKHKVKLLGEMDNPFVELKQADVFALLSEYEGLPNTIFEALILGVPVLATNVGGISNQVSDNKTGWLVENEYEMIKQKIIYLLENPSIVAEAKNNLMNYEYNTLEIEKNLNEIFNINHR